MKRPKLVFKEGWAHDAEGEPITRYPSKMGTAIHLLDNPSRHGDTYFPDIMLDNILFSYMHIEAHLDEEYFPEIVNCIFKNCYIILSDLSFEVGAIKDCIFLNSTILLEPCGLSYDTIVKSLESAESIDHNIFGSTQIRWGSLDDHSENELLAWIGKR